MGLREDIKNFLEEKSKKIEEIQNKINIKLNQKTKLENDKNQLKNEIEKEFDEKKLASIKALDKDLSNTNEIIKILNSNKKHVENKRFDCPIDLVRKEALGILKEKEIKKQFDKISKAKQEYINEVNTLYDLTEKTLDKMTIAQNNMKSLNLNLIRKENDNFEIEPLDIKKLGLYFSSEELHKLEHNLLMSDIYISDSYDILKNYK